jgi:hypothetical protein
MSKLPDDVDLQEIAVEADVELQETEAVGLTELGSYEAELGYYQAELTSLRDAATTLGDAELTGE